MGCVFGPLIVAYLFVGGMGAAAAAVLGVIGITWALRDAAIVLPLRGKRPYVATSEDIPAARLFAGGFAVATVCVVAGVTCLALDVGRIENIVALLVPRLTYLTFGTYALAACVAFSAAAGLLWAVRPRPVRRSLFLFVHGAAVVAGACVVGYTSVLLASMPAVPLWNSPFLTTLFALSSASCGIALVLAVAHFALARDGAARFQRAIRSLSLVDVGCVLLEAASLALLVGFALAPAEHPANGTDEALAASVQKLLFGESSWLFWVVFVGAGLMAALALDVLTALRPRWRPAGFAACACVMAGGLALRWCAIACAAHPTIQVASLAAGG